MPFAQWHYPFENREWFEGRHPADYICEAIDQTRGWFFTLLAESVLLFDKPAYRNVICLSHVVDSGGRKMSKSRGNTIEPGELFDEFGADAVRWYFYSSVSAGAEYRVGRELLQEVVRRFLLTLWNTYSFLVSYAELDGFDPALEAPDVLRRPALDRWALARLAQTTDTVREALDRYDATDACRALEALIEDISKWYVRRSRRRFWKEATSQDGDGADKRAAYATLHTVLHTLARLLAPFTPFLAERIYRNLSGFEGDHPPEASTPDSVHLTGYPRGVGMTRDADLLRDMARLRRLVEAGLAARETAGIKVRQPLSTATVRGERFDAELESIFADELNVHRVAYAVREGAHEDVVLDTELTDELRLEGIARELSRAGNALRKQAGLALDERISLLVDCADGGDVARAVAAHRQHLAREVLATSVALGDVDSAAARSEVKLGGEAVRLGLSR